MLASLSQRAWTRYAAAVLEETVQLSNAWLVAKEYSAADLPEHSIVVLAAVPAGTYCNGSWMSFPPVETGV